MSTTPQVVFQVRPEAYASLTLEAFQSLATETDSSPLDPPLPQPILDQQQAAADIRTARFSRPWARWFVELSTTGGPGDQQLIVIAPSVDETDAEWYGTGSIDGSTDPVTFTPGRSGQSRFGMLVQMTAQGSGYTSNPTVTITDKNAHTVTGTPTRVGGKVVSISVSTSGFGLTPPLSVSITGGGGAGATAIATLGRQWAVGDYIIWNDPGHYEIDKITNINIGTGAFTLQRAGPSAVTREAQFGSLKGAHASAAFYRLITQSFPPRVLKSAGPQMFRYIWDNMCVAAVQCWIGGVLNSTINLAALNAQSTPVCPGLRTMNGAAYTTLGVRGVLAGNTTSDNRVSVQAHESIRTVYAKVRTAPTGKPIVIYVVYISPSGTVGLIDKITIAVNALASYGALDPPDGRQMPYHDAGSWPFTSPNNDWPPNRLPSVNSGLDGSGNLVFPITLDPNSTVAFEPDGDIDFGVTQVGDIFAGEDLLVTVQT